MNGDSISNTNMKKQVEITIKTQIVNNANAGKKTGTRARESSERQASLEKSVDE